MTLREFLEYVSKWLKVIGDVFAKYPLAAAIVTIAAVWVFLLLIKHYELSDLKSIEVKDWAKVALILSCVLVGWLILVPLVGLVLDSVVVLGQFVTWLYSRYEKQPLFVITVTGIAITIGSFWVYHPRWRDASPERSMRVLATSAVWLALILIGVPVLEVFNPSQATVKKAASAALNATYRAQAQATKHNNLTTNVRHLITTSSSFEAKAKQTVAV